jgi:hypothetical protein
MAPAAYADPEEILAGFEKRVDQKKILNFNSE